MSFASFFGSGRAALAASCIAALCAVNCGGRSQRDSARGSSGKAGASGGVDGSLGARSQGGELHPSGGRSAEWSGGRPSGGTASSGTAGNGAAPSGAGAGGNLDGWTLPHTSDKPWRQSLEPLCAPEGSGLPWDLWSDQRGLYVLSEFAFGENRLYFNDGTGWSTARLSQPNSYGLTGFNEGSLVLYSGAPCGVLFQGQSEDVCASTLPNVSDVFVVDANRIFAIAGNRVLRYNGDYFVQYGKPLPGPAPTRPYSFWADAEVVIVASDQGQVYIFSDATSAAEVLTMPEGAAARALWAFSRDDIWVGLEGSRLAHYDGANWTVQSLGDSACDVVTALFGTDHVLFFAGGSFVGKVQDGAVELFSGAPRCQSEAIGPGTWEELIFRKIWGNSPNEVFFAVTERRLELKEVGGTLQTNAIDPDTCGMQRLYWYDGTRIRPL
ncbi:MAG TPA: hypothetical protein VG937_06485 [Polyangiaceae bacterium]|nr:hypothetical protein [Polyangiaceae bacterium]